MNLRLFLLALCFAFSLQLFSQDTLKKNRSAVGEYFMTCMNVNIGPQFPRNETIKEQYNTNSTLYLGVGFQFGIQSDIKPNFYLNYNYSAYEMQTRRSTPDTILKYNEIQIGFHVPFFETELVQPNLDFAVNFGNVLNKFNSMNPEPTQGIKCGLQFNVKTKNSYFFFFGMNYNYLKTPTGVSRSHDHVRLNVGFTLPFF